MRRAIAVVLFLLFVSQSSGVALAATSSSPGVRVDLGALVDPIRSAIIGSNVYALLTGTSDRYEAMHAAKPTIVQPPADLNAAALLRAEHPLRPIARAGVRRKVEMPPLSELNRVHRRLDPLAMRRSQLTPQALPQSTTGPLLGPLRSLVLPQVARGGRSGPTRHRGGFGPMAASTATTGIEHWWTYEERAIPGIGKAMLNVGTGNLVVSAMDVDVPEQGIDLAFQRVYNSQSLHDYQGDDGGDDAIFGNRWTNNFDTNIVYNSTANTITVYDIDGAACTYTSNTDGTWQPCTGEYATLAPTDTTDCTYAWTKPNGTVYWFHSDQNGLGCGIQLAKKGHLQQILARNNTNNITFTYSYNGQGNAAEDVTEIDADHSDGQELIMKFGLIPGTTINELSTITRPDGAVLQYSYDTAGNLLEVDKPGNNSANSVPNNPNSAIKVPEGDAPETYAYASGTSSMNEACGPRCTVSIWNNQIPRDGAALVFTLDGSLRLTSWDVDGALNITPDDSTSTPLEPKLSTNYKNWYTANFVYGNGSNCTAAAAGATTMCDTDGHATTWTTDNSDRVAQTQEWTQPSQAIVTSQGWDTNNDLISTTDPNANTTKYGYDSPGYAQGGNLVEMLLPTLGDESGGTVSLSTYSYDHKNNVIAYCDPVFNQTAGNGWNGSPGDGLCASATGAARFGYNTSDTNEPYGCLVSITKPSGYDTAIAYGTSGCGGGLPTSTTGDTITQGNNPSRTPTQDFAYDGYGNLNSYDKGTDPTLGRLDHWTLGYSLDNQVNYRTEHDTQIPITASSFSCYYPDGSLYYTETPAQHDSDSDPTCPLTTTLLAGPNTPPPHATAYYYDLDGDQIEIVDHKGCSTVIGCNGPTPTTACNTTQRQGSGNPTGTTCKYYDGLDRLVETAEPYDTRAFGTNGQNYEFYAFRWMNRYIYDLSMSGGGASLTIADAVGSAPAFVAYGNLYKTREYLPTNGYPVGKLSNGPYQTGGWEDLRGTSFDPLDRPVGKYELAYGNAAVTTNTYDCTGQLGLLCSTKNALGQTTSYIYDNINRIKEVDFSGSAPLAYNRVYTFDPDGRTATANNSMGTLSYSYDVDGNEKSVTEPSGEDAASLICYNYYPDGLREYLSIAPANVGVGNCAGISQGSPGHGIYQSHLFNYAYTLDDRLAIQHVNWNGITYNNTVPTFTWTYTSSGREATEQDPLYGSSVTIPTGGGGNASIGSKSYSYDPYGRVNKLVFPEGFQLSTYMYDGDDELAAYNVGGQNGITRTFALNSRGELLRDDFGGQLYGYAQGWTQSANGAQVGNGDNEKQETPNIQAPPGTLQFDMRSNMTTCVPDTQWANHGQQADYTYKFDAAGRQTKAYPDTSNSCAPPGTGSTTTSYDAENHISQTTNPWALTFGYGGPMGSSGTVTYGPDARYRSDAWVDVNNNSNSDGVHWDGDSILFVSTMTGNQSTAPTLYLGKLGFMYSSGNIEIVDRDQTGTQLTDHGFTGGTNAWFPGLSLGTVRNVTTKLRSFPLYISVGSCNFTSGVNTYTCPLNNAPTYAMTRSDGYGMVGGIVQGARTYDPTSGQWVTPDAYAGDVHDPMSQKPFMWNNNSPMNYGDPTGFDAIYQGNDGSGAQAEFTDWSLTGETEATYASAYFTTIDVQNAVQSGYATTVMSLHHNLNPHDVSDQSFLANEVHASLSKHHLGPWSLTSNYLTSTLSGASKDADIGFALQILVGEVYLALEQGGITNLAEEQFLRYTHFPGADEIIQERNPAGWNIWYNSDVTPDENIKD